MYFSDPINKKGAKAKIPLDPEVHPQIAGRNTKSKAIHIIFYTMLLFIFFRFLHHSMRPINLMVVDISTLFGKTSNLVTNVWKRKQIGVAIK